MTELLIERLFPLLKMTYEELTPENAAKILLWCSLFLDAWKMLVVIFRLIKSWEEAVETMKKMILDPDKYVETWIPEELAIFATLKQKEFLLSEGWSAVASFIIAITKQIVD